MMSWTNFAFLGIGLLVGLSIGWWFWRSRPQSTTSQRSYRSASPDVPPMPSDDAETLALRSQLHQAQVARQLAEEMGQFKAGFLARTSHELRSPLNSVISLHQLILSDLCDNPAEERDFVSKAHTAALKMLSLLDELISVAKTAHGSHRLEIQPVQLKALLADVYRLTHLQAENRSLRLEIESPTSDLYVIADPRWLRQVLVSLLDTPIALMYEGTIRLTLHPSPQSNQMHIWVEDERPTTAWQEPIDLLASSNQSDRTVDSFMLEKERLQPSTNPEVSEKPGSLNPGLGLLLNQMVMEMMQGRLDLLAVPSKQPAAKVTSGAIVASEADVITRIQCTIPLATDGERM